MKKLLTPQKGFYKANLHCHTTLSDGKKTPAEIKELYQSLGYSIVAYTDHDVLVPHHDLTDARFLALSGFEMEVREQLPDIPKRHLKCCHICYIALDADNIVQPMWNPAYLFGNAKESAKSVTYDPTETPFVRTYDGACISEMMRIGRERGFFVTYNHPTWSLERYPQYTAYTGMHAMEVMNGGCIVEGYDDYNARIYDDFLCNGQRIFCIGTDDNHNKFPGTRDWDSGIAYTVINAESLTYSAVTDALLAGNFYSSEGPEILSLDFADDTLFVTCSAADRILCTYPSRKAGVVYAENGVALTTAQFSLTEEDKWARITITDAQGKHAYTNAYFYDELTK